MPLGVQPEETVRVIRRCGASAACLDVDALVALADGALSAARGEYAKAHIAHCDACRELFEALASGAELLPQASADSSAVACVTAVRSAQLQAEGASEAGAFEPGQAIDHFEVLQLLGRGGMGAVYLARDTKLDRRVALKVITTDQLREPGATERFMREARITARVNHPAIVTIHAVGEHHGVPYLALEYIAGVSLRKWMAEPRSESEVIDVAATIAEALAEAHRHGVLHRDLKPDNVLIDRKGRARVLDFGIAETVHLDEPPPSRLPGHQEEVGPIVTGLAGTPRYMAPEQWQETSCTGATDVWALGIMLYQMLVGEHPFGNTADRLQLITAVLTADDSLPPGPLEKVSEPLRTLVRRCLRESPDERPDAANLAGELRSLTTLVTHTASLNTASLNTAERIAAPRPTRRSAVWLAALGAAALGGVLALALFSDARSPESAPQSTASAAATRVDPAVAPTKEAMPAPADTASSDPSPSVSANATASAPGPRGQASTPRPPPFSRPTVTATKAPSSVPAPQPPATGELLKQW